MAHASSAQRSRQTPITRDPLPRLPALASASGDTDRTSTSAGRSGRWNSGVDRTVSGTRP